MLPVFILSGSRPRVAQIVYQLFDESVHRCERLWSAPAAVSLCITMRKRDLVEIGDGCFAAAPPRM